MVEYEIGVLLVGSEMFISDSVEVELVKLSILKVEVVVLVAVDRCVVTRVVSRSRGLNDRLACEHVCRLVILGHGDVEAARYAFVLLKLKGRPLSVVDKLGQRLLQLVKHGVVGSLNLTVVYRYTGVQLLCRYLVAWHQEAACRDEGEQRNTQR